MTSLQARAMSVLAPTAMKLLKLTGDKKFLLWYAFGLSCGKDTVALALATLNKALAAQPEPDSFKGAADASRRTCGGRTALYLGLFKLQLLVRLDRFEEAEIVVNAIESPMISTVQRGELLGDIAVLKNAGVSFEDSDTSPNPIRCMQALIVADGALGVVRNGIWNCQENESKFFGIFLAYLDSARNRSDCMVTLSQFLPLVGPPYHGRLLAHALDGLKGEKLGRGLVTLYKLVYALDWEQIDADALIRLALTIIPTEHVLDECSPGKQLLLLGAIVLLENWDVPSAVCILSFGSAQFTHCSHFRLVECLLYAKLGLTEKVLDRFRALGVKNAQWCSLFWLVHSMFVRFHTAPESRADIAENIQTFLSRHRLDINNLLPTLVEEQAFFKFPEYREIQALSAAQRWADFELGVQKVDPDHQTPDAYDHSPLLFLMIPEPGSSSTHQAREDLVRRRLLGPRVCGFRWDRHQIDSASSEQTLRARLSPERVLGKLSAPVSGSDLPEFTKKVHQAVASVRDSWEDGKLEVVSSHTLLSLLNQIVENLGRADDIEQTLFKSPVLAWMGALLNGALVDLVVVVETGACKFSKKSSERKFAKKFLASLKLGLEGLMLAIRTFEQTVSKHVWTVSLPAELASSGFAETLTADVMNELSGLQNAFGEICARICASSV